MFERLCVHLLVVRSLQFVLSNRVFQLVDHGYRFVFLRLFVALLPLFSASGVDARYAIYDVVVLPSFGVGGDESKWGELSDDRPASFVGGGLHCDFCRVG